MPSPLRVSSLAPRRNGDLSCFEEVEQTEAQKRYEQERAGGNYGTGTREIQTRNYIAAKEAARKRQEMFNDALEDFRAGKVEDALQVLLSLLFEYVFIRVRCTCCSHVSSIAHLPGITSFHCACAHDCFSAYKALDW